MTDITPTPPPDTPRLADRRLLRFNEACEVLGITMPTLRRAVDQGHLVCVQAPGTWSSKGKRILAESIDAFLADQIPSSASRKSSA